MITSRELAIQTVRDWFTAGNTTETMAEAFAKEFPAYAFLDVFDAVVQSLREAGAEDTEFVTGWAATAAKELYRKSREIGDYSNALRALRAYVELMEKGAESNRKARAFTKKQKGGW